MPRQKLEIDEEQVRKLAKLGATNVDIADFFGCDKSTIGKRFSTILTKGRAERKIALRSWQWKAAEGGNIAMLIWLGKQELGQADKVETKNEISAPLIDRQRQHAMLGNERALELACDLEQELRAGHP